MKKNIRRILKEELQPTETEFLGIDIPDYLVDQLNIRNQIKNDTDVVAISEIHFDTKNALIELYEVDEYGELDNYIGTTIQVKDLPLDFLMFIIENLNKYYIGYLYNFLDIIPAEKLQALRNRNIRD